MGRSSLSRRTGEGDDFQLRLLSTYGYKQRKNVPNKFRFGEALVGQAALEQKSILVTQAPEDYVRISSGLGEGLPQSDRPPRALRGPGAGGHRAGFVPALRERAASLPRAAVRVIGVVLNTIGANMRTEELLSQSQGLTQELQSQSEELQAQQEELQQSNKELEEQAASLKASEELLQTQQEELQQTNEELEEKAQLLEEQNRRIEIKNREIELARAALEEKAEQLSLSSRYKSEFLANMSHELRTPLNSLLILAKLLGENPEANLNDKQIEFADTVSRFGEFDLLVVQVCFRVLAEQVREDQQLIQRRPELVRHVRQELGLVARRERELAAFFSSSLRAPRSAVLISSGELHFELLGLLVELLVRLPKLLLLRLRAPPRPSGRQPVPRVPCSTAAAPPAAPAALRTGSAAPASVPATATAAPRSACLRRSCSARRRSTRTAARGRLAARSRSAGTKPAR